MMEHSGNPGLSVLADALEQKMATDLEAALVPVKAVIYESGDRDPRDDLEVTSFNPKYAGKHFVMKDDPRLVRMPKKPRLRDFFELRFGSIAHGLQSARLARISGHDEKIVFACLLHDIAVMGFIRGDHGYWGAQMIEPYVDPEVTWAIRMHQALRFYPDPSVGYEYPKAYVKNFGADFKPEPYVEAAYLDAKKHKWYMTSRLITINDLYAFDPTVSVSLDDFSDLMEKYFRQPEEGLGWDNSPSAHMWRTINWPTRFL